MWGDFACFTRPEFKVERMSYDIITPSAARAIFESILFKKYAMRWQITKIEVLNPIKWISIKKNEVGALAGRKPILIEEKRQQRNNLMLRDVHYRIWAKLIFIPVSARPKAAFAKHEPDKSENPMKYYEMFERRASQGQCFRQPYFGTRECAAFWRLVDTGKKTLTPALNEDKDLGFMLYDMDYDRNPDKPDPMFYHAEMKQGVIIVPEKNSREVLK